MQGDGGQSQFMPKYTLDWRTKLLFWLMSRGPSLADADLQKVRSGADSKILSTILFRPIQMTAVEDRSIPGRQSPLPVRIYRPIQEANLPVVVFFHGGGWALGGLNGHDAICRRIARENGALVVSSATPKRAQSIDHVGQRKGKTARSGRRR
jgi:acetyl esterase/lipase